MVVERTQNIRCIGWKKLKNSAHERLSQDNVLENTALKVFLFVTEHIDVEMR